MRSLMKVVRFFIDNAVADDAVEFMQRLKVLVAEDPDREVFINSAKPFGVEPLQQLATLIRQVGSDRRRTRIDPDDDAIADRAAELLAANRCHLVITTLSRTAPDPTISPWYRLLTSPFRVRFRT